MKNLFLAIDIGNTHIVLGIFENEKLVSDCRITSQSERTTDEFGFILRQFCDINKIQVNNIYGSGISSVVPRLTNLSKAAVKKYLDVEALKIDNNLNLGIKILYKDSSQVGVDRICNSVAAFSNYGGPLIIIDFGTATTFDVISERGEYLGGIIVPGIETSAIDLQRKAAKLPKIELQYPEEIIGRDTISSMQSGILYGAVDSTQGIIERINKQIRRKTTVIATGGFSKLISEKCPLIDQLEPYLVLEGIRLIYNKNKQFLQ